MSTLCSRPRAVHWNVEYKTHTQKSKHKKMQTHTHTFSFRLLWSARIPNLSKASVLRRIECFSQRCKCFVATAHWLAQCGGKKSSTNTHKELAIIYEHFAVAISQLELQHTYTWWYDSILFLYLRLLRWVLRLYGKSILYLYALASWVPTKEHHNRKIAPTNKTCIFLYNKIRPTYQKLRCVKKKTQLGRIIETGKGNL